MFHVHPLIIFGSIGAILGIRAYTINSFLGLLVVMPPINQQLISPKLTSVLL
jgi:hypothetical protein